MNSSAGVRNDGFANEVCERLGGSSLTSQRK
jgi:hypothetical protein